MSDKRKIPPLVGDVLAANPLAGGLYDAGLMFDGPEGRADVMKRLKAKLAAIADFGGLTSELAPSAVGDALKRYKGAAPVSSGLTEFVSPTTLAKPIYDVGRGLWDAATEEDEPAPKLVSKDEFLKERRKARPSLQEALDAAEKRVTESPAYLKEAETGHGARATAMVTKARENAKSGWEADQGTIGGEEAKLNADYETYKSGHDKRLEEYYGRDFKDRNPGLSRAFASGGTLAAALLTRGAVKGVNSKIGGILDEIPKAKGVADEAQLLKRLEWWNKNAGKTKLASGAAAATIPMDLQAAGVMFDRHALSPTYQDSQGQWQPALAQERAEEKNLLAGAPASLVSGTVGSLVGAKLGGKGRPDEMAGILNPPDAAALNSVVQRRLQAAQAEADLAQGLQSINAPRPLPVAPPQAPPANPGAGPIPVAGPQGPMAPGPQPVPAPNSGPLTPGPQIFDQYRGRNQLNARAAWSESLDAVPQSQRASYRPDINQAITAIQGRAPGLNPVDIQRRASNSQQAFDAVRASGGDPFSPAGRGLQFGGKDKLAIPLAAGGAAAATIEQVMSSDLPDDQKMALLRALQQSQVSGPQGLLSETY